MLKCCEGCKVWQNCSFEEQKAICGKCRECVKAEMVPHALENKELFGGKRWRNGKTSKIPSRAVVELYERGVKQVELAEIFGVTQAAISKILKRERGK